MLGDTAEQGLVQAPPEQPKRPFLEALKSFAETTRDIESDKARLAAWKARSIQPGQDIPATGEPSSFEDGSPEQKLAEFLLYWKARNYGRMVQCLPFIEHKYDGKKLPLKLRTHYETMALKSFEIIEVEDEASAVTNIKAKLFYEENGTDAEKVANFRLLHEDAAGQPVPRGKPGGSWVLYTSRV